MALTGEGFNLLHYRVCCCGRVFAYSGLQLDRQYDQRDAAQTPELQARQTLMRLSLVDI
jgi:hypothetical protein